MAERTESSITVEAAPDGLYLFITNRDIPGVIGEIGSVLGARGVNIASMNLGRDRASGRALALVGVDSTVDANPRASPSARASNQCARILHRSRPRPSPAFFSRSWWPERTCQGPAARPAGHLLQRRNRA
jgi:hypothetical protein